MHKLVMRVWKNHRPEKAQRLCLKQCMEHYYLNPFFGGCKITRGTHKFSVTHLHLSFFFWTSAAVSWWFSNCVLINHLLLAWILTNLSRCYSLFLSRPGLFVTSKSRFLQRHSVQSPFNIVYYIYSSKSSLRWHDGLSVSKLTTHFFIYFLFLGE